MDGWMDCLIDYRRHRRRLYVPPVIWVGGAGGCSKTIVGTSLAARIGHRARGDRVIITYGE